MPARRLRSFSRPSSSGDDVSTPRREPTATAALSLRLSRDGERPLTKAQKRFDTLVRRVETLRAERVRMIARWDKFLHLYRERIHPEERRMVERRRQVARLLGASWRAPKGLGARQREQLEDLLRAQLRELVEFGREGLDAELRAIWEELHPSPPEADDRDDEPVNPKEESVPRPGEDERRATEAGEPTARVNEREEARKRTVVSIYKQLAKALHPDLEQEPAMRDRKHVLMQELTKAHREGDLHTLLRLELEWIKREEGDLERLGDEKLAIYSELLEEQVVDLREEIRDVALTPRFSAMARFMNPIGGGPEDVEKILLSIRQMSESLKAFRDALGGPKGREALRTILAEVGARQAQAKARGFEHGF